MLLCTNQLIMMTSSIGVRHTRVFTIMLKPFSSFPVRRILFPFSTERHDKWTGGVFPSLHKFKS